ncbi:MAG: hypothetical protein ACE5HT_16020 [Gemmatimonadales bacterium]
MFTVKRLLRGVSAALVVAALTFGTTQAFAATATACNEPGQIGTCPPFTMTSCNDKCVELFWSGGECFAGCCQCAI